MINDGMMENEKKGRRGGKREGAGRPRSDSKLYTFRAPGRMAMFIDAQDCKTEFIKGCIAKEMGALDAGIGKMGEVYPVSGVTDLRLPFFDVGIVAGFPIPLDNDERSQDIELLKMLCPNPEATYLIRVEGESMRDADIHTGDILVVDKSNRQPTPRQVAMCELDGEYTVKYVEKTSEGFRLIPANADYPAIEVGPRNRFSVWGVVTYVIHSPRH